MRVGSDPEFLIGINGKVFPSGMLISAPINTDGYVFYVDNASVETNIYPADDVDQFVGSIKRCLKALRDNILSIIPGSSIMFSPCGDVDENFDHPTLKQWGCNPDFNAFSGEENKVCDIEKNTRFAGGHLHVDFTGNVIDQVKLMDIYVGVPMAKMEGSGGLTRREYYGRAGAFRYKDYGLEYRVPSSMWLRSEKNVRNIWKAVEGATEAYKNGERVNNKELEGHIVNAVNNLNERSISFIESRFSLVEI